MKKSSAIYFNIPCRLRCLRGGGSGTLSNSSISSFGSRFLIMSRIMRVGRGLLHRGCCKLGYCVVIWMLWRYILAMSRGGRCRARREFDGFRTQGGQHKRRGQYTSRAFSISSRSIHLIVFLASKNQQQSNAKCVSPLRKEKRTTTKIRSQRSSPSLAFSSIVFFPSHSPRNYPRNAPLEGKEIQSRCSRSPSLWLKQIHTRSLTRECFNLCAAHLPSCWTSCSAASPEAWDPRSCESRSHRQG